MHEQPASPGDRRGAASPTAWPSPARGRTSRGKVTSSPRSATRSSRFSGAGGVGVKGGRNRDEANEWLARYPDDASVMAYIGRSGWNTLPYRRCHPRRRDPASGRRLLRPGCGETARSGCGQRRHETSAAVRIRAGGSAGCVEGSIPSRRHRHHGICQLLDRGCCPVPPAPTRGGRDLRVTGLS